MPLVVEKKRSREDVLFTLAHASVMGSLGMFIGSGVTTALTIKSAKKAPNWRELLETCAETLEVEYPDDEERHGLGFPQIASLLIARLASKVTTDETGAAVPSEQRHAYATGMFKRCIAKECRFSVHSKTAEHMRTSLRSVDPAWVVTTNYDTCFEGLLEYTQMLLPGAPMAPSRRITPVYHLHGHVLAPDSIVITDSDYVDAIRPFGYRQAKLATLFSESTVLVLGYELADINVQSAMDHSRSFHNGAQRPVVQIKFVREDPQPEPYVGPHGTEVVESSDISAFLREVSDLVDDYRTRAEATRTAVRKLIEDPKARLAVRDDADVRKSTLAEMKLQTALYGTRDAIEALDLLFSEIWSDAREDDGWENYTTYIRVLLGCLKRWDPEAAPGMFAFLFDRLSQVAYYINESPSFSAGRATAASKVWRAEWPKLAERTRTEIRTHATAMYDLNVLRITGGIE